ncbi:MAG: type IX secretion system membrane protein PorP/SprF, partial [Flavobacteriales bacterium]|nr:type IX secretion system membrane protein PorP/SprF [Flavobacteriales bacterium]
LVGLVLASCSLSAQQYVQFTHFMYNTMSINPAYAGSRDMLNVTGLYRNQWAGLDGAPETINLYAHSPVGKGVGMGLSFINDKVGPISQTNLTFSGSYTIQTSETGKLAFGLNGALNMFQGNTQTLKTVSPDDPSVMNGVENTSHGNFGAGVYYYTDKFYAGFSAPKLLKEELKVGNSVNNSIQHYYLLGGLMIDINEDLIFKPSLMTKFASNSPMSVDLSAQVLFQEKIWGGLMYRWQDAFGLLVGYQFTDQFQLGYSYDINTSKLNQVNSGSHEIYMSYDFIFKSDKVISPRLF